MKRIILIWSLLILLHHNGYSQSADAKYSGEFLVIPVGMRASALGGAFTGAANDGSAFYWNPSGTTSIKGILISSQYSSQFGSINDPLSNYFFTGYSQSLDEYGAFSINWIRLSVDDISYYDDLGPSRDSRISLSKQQYENHPMFNNSQDAFFINFAKDLFYTVDYGWQFFKVTYKIPVGINLKYLRFANGGKAGQTANGFGFDAGVMVITNLNEYFTRKIYGDLKFGLTVRDVSNTLVTWNDNKQFAINRSVVWGISYTQPLPIWYSDLMFVYDRVNSYNLENNVGLEWIYDKQYAIRIGSKNGEFTTGIGLILYGGISIDYAFEVHELGNPHRLGISFRMDQIKW